jgi:hypothetical protein
LATERPKARQSRSKKTQEQREAEQKNKADTLAKRMAKKQVKDYRKAAKDDRIAKQEEEKKRQDEFESEMYAELEEASNVTTRISCIFRPDDVQHLTDAFAKAKRVLVKLTSEEGMKMDAKVRRQLQAKGEGAMKAAAETVSVEDDPPMWSLIFLATLINTQSQMEDSEDLEELSDNEVAEVQKKTRPGRKQTGLVKRKGESIKKQLKCMDRASKKMIELQRLDNQEKKKNGTQDAPEDEFTPSEELKALQDDCDKLSADLKAKLEMLYDARLRESDPSLTEPLLQVLYFDGKKGVHVLKGGPQEVGFPMALPLFQAHVVGDTAVAGGMHRELSKYGVPTSSQ